jgi:hypothetical protein
MKRCDRCFHRQGDYVAQYSEDDLHFHEVIAHHKCELCSEFFNDGSTRDQHLAEVHGKMYLSHEEPIWPDVHSDLVDIPQWRRRVDRPEITPFDMKSREDWLRGFALLMVEEAAAGRAENLLRRPPPEFRDQAQYVNWVEANHPKSAKAWELARYRNRERSKTAKANFLRTAWAHAEEGAPTFWKNKNL